MNRFDRVTSLLVLLQTQKLLTGAELAARFGVSLRTIYRDLRTLEAAGVPLSAEAGQGYALAEGYRLPPVHFTREEATALFTAEKLLMQHADPSTTQLLLVAMDKLRAVLRRPDRDYLASLATRVQMLPAPVRRAEGPAPGSHYQALLASVAERRVVRLHYQAGQATGPSPREVEPIGIYYGQYWHVVAYCRLRQAFRDFRLDRIQRLVVLAEQFAPRPDTLASYRAEQAARQQREVVVVRFGRAALPRLEAERHSLGWQYDQVLPDDTIEMTFMTGCLVRFARWLLPFGALAEPVSPPALATQLAAEAQAVYQHFVEKAEKK